MPRDDDPRAKTNPLFNNNRLKLGVFAFNGGGATMTTVPEQYQLSWPNTLDVAQQADRAGYEALVPYARWRSFVGPEHRSGYVFETLTWAAGLAAQTDYSAVMSTCHVPIVHPLLTAKAAATIDAISGGRFALNIVCGWFEPEIEMFNLAGLDHDRRYRFADEWITAVKRLWSEEDYVDISGEYVRLERAMSQPKPIQKPFPALMNAGGSDAGRRFVAKHCDLAFVIPRTDDDAVIKQQVEDYRNLARETSGRDVQVWSSAYVAQAETREDALKYSTTTPCKTAIIRMSMHLSQKASPDPVSSDRPHYKNCVIRSKPDWQVCRYSAQLSRSWTNLNAYRAAALMVFCLSGWTFRMGFVDSTMKCCR